MKKPFAIITDNGRVVKNSILDQYAIKEASKQLQVDAFHNKYGEKGLVSPLYNPSQLAGILELNTYHMRCCKVKARDSAGLGWLISAIRDDAPEAEQQKLQDFFDGQVEPIAQTLDKVMYDYEAIGYAACELVRLDTGEPANLYHLPAHTLRIHKEGNRFCQEREGKYRWFKKAGEDIDVHMDDGNVYPSGSLDKEKRASEIIWFTNYTPKSDYYGMPDIIPAIGAIYGDVSRRNYNISFFENYGVPAYAVFITGDYDEGELDELGRSQFEVAIEEHFKAMKNKPHSTLIMSVPSATGGDVKVEFKPLSLETKEASFRLYRLDNRDEVLSAHAVPPYRAGIAETGSLGGSTAKEATEIYKISVIEPRQEMLEAAINLHIVRNGFQVFGWEFKLGSIDNTDEKHDLAMLQGLFAMGCVTPNQVISFFGKRFGLVKSDLPEMNYHYINGRPVEAGAKEEAIDSTLKALDATLQKVAYKNVQNV